MIGAGGSNLTIGISLVMRDMFSGQMARARGQLAGMSKEALAAQKAQMTMQRNMAAGGAVMGMFAINGMRQWAKVGADYGYTMKYVETIADQGAVSFEKLSTKAKTLGQETMFTARQVADGMKFMAMAGQDTDMIYKNIAASVHLAGATMSRLEGKGGGADILTNVMKGFNIEASEKNSMRVADILTTATTSANTNLWDLHEGMKYAVSTASTLGGGLEEVAAGLMMMGNAGIQGSMAGIAMENMYRYIGRAARESTTGRQGKALASLGLQPDQLKDSEGKLHKLSTLLHTIFNQFGKLESQDKTKGLETVFGYNVMADLFNVRGNRGAIKLTQNMEAFDGFIERLSNNSTGRATNNTTEMMDNLRGATLQLNSAWETWKINFTEAIEPVIIPLLKQLTKLVKGLSGFAATGLGSWMTVAFAGAVVLKTAIFTYRAIVISLKLHHMAMASTFGAASTTVTAGYGKMTTAAMAYGNAAGLAAAKAGMGSVSGMTARGSQYVIGKGGRSKFIKKGSMPLGYSTGVGRGIGKFGKIAGKGMLPAMIAGWGLNMLSDKSKNEQGNKSGWGKAAGIGGSVIGMAGTGAMIGSMIPGIGTGIGAIIGGAYGLFAGLQENLEDVNEAIADAKKEEPKSRNSAQEIKDQIATLRAMKEGDKLNAVGYNRNTMWAVNKYQQQRFMANGQIGGGMNKSSNITINIDGRAAFSEMIDKDEYTKTINLGGL